MLVPCTNQSGDSAHATPAWEEPWNYWQESCSRPPALPPTLAIRRGPFGQLAPNACNARSGLLARFRYADELASKLGGPPR